MSKIYIVRHGETVWNVEDRFQGWENSNLTKKGRQQAKAIGKFLKEVKIEQIYCSPLKRCKDTFKIIKSAIPNLQTINIIEDDRLKECSYGNVEGLIQKQVVTHLLLKGIDRRDPEIKFNFKFLQGESYKDQLVRLLNFVDTTNLQFTKDNTLIVCHMGTMKYLSIILQNKLDMKDIYEVTMWRPSNNILVIFDTENNSLDLVEL